MSTTPSNLKCEDVTFDMRDSHHGESPLDAAFGDLVWDPKAGDGHILVGEQLVQFGWEEPWPLLICECGRGDLLNHHVVVLRRSGVAR